MSDQIAREGTDEKHPLNEILRKYKILDKYDKKYYMLTSIFLPEEGDNASVEALVRETSTKCECCEKDRTCVLPTLCNECSPDDAHKCSDCAVLGDSDDEKPKCNKRKKRIIAPCPYLFVRKIVDDFFDEQEQKKRERQRALDDLEDDGYSLADSESDGVPNPLNTARIEAKKSAAPSTPQKKPTELKCPGAPKKKSKYE
jgi:hypothetical protein